MMTLTPSTILGILFFYFLHLSEGFKSYNLTSFISYWINQVWSKSEDGMNGLIKPKTLHKAQGGIKQHLDTLLVKERKFVEKQHLPSGQEYWSTGQTFKIVQRVFFFKNPFF